MMNDKEKELIVRDMLIEIGENPNREGLIDTPKRIVKMWKEIFRGYDINQKPKLTVFNNGSDGFTVNEMITDSGLFYSNCEHHMLPFIGNYYFAYIPNENGKVLGLSKIARIVDYYSAKLQVQERLVEEIVNEIYKNLSENTEFKPLGVALVMEAEHLCKTMRGVKKKGKMRTTKLLGVFKDDEKTRMEFMSWVDKYKGD
jgi:GTP cyclohydrolase IA